MFYSQFGEDKLLAQLYRQKPTGTCVEVGANDGVNDSTTFYFEQQGWRCVLVEPNPMLCKRIRATRAAALYECAASERSGTATLHVAEGAPRAHGVSALGDPGTTPTSIEKHGFTSQTVEVVTRTLDSILEDAGVEAGIDFITIDVEGHELQVLGGLSLGRWAPRILLLEDNSNFESDEVQKYLRTCGYFPFMRTGVNDWYAHRDDKELVSLSHVLRYHLVRSAARTRSRIRAIPGVARVKRRLARALRRT